MVIFIFVHVLGLNNFPNLLLITNLCERQDIQRSSFKKPVMQLSFRKVLARFNICTVLAVLKLTLTDNLLNDIRVTGFPSKLRWISYPTHL